MEIYRLTLNLVENRILLFKIILPTRLRSIKVSHYNILIIFFAFQRISLATLIICVEFTRWTRIDASFSTMIADWCGISSNCRLLLFGIDIFLLQLSHCFHWYLWHDWLSSILDTYLRLFSERKFEILSCLCWVARLSKHIVRKLNKSFFYFCKLCVKTLLSHWNNNLLSICRR